MAKDFRGGSEFAEAEDQGPAGRPQDDGEAAPRQEEGRACWCLCELLRRRAVDAMCAVMHAGWIPTLWHASRPSASMYERTTTAPEARRGRQGYAAKQTPGGNKKGTPVAPQPRAEGTL